MGLFDIILMIAILGGAFWLLYHSLWKKKGHCPGSCSGSCNSHKNLK